MYVFGIILLYMYFRNYFMPLAYDDYVYAFVWNGTDFFNEMSTRSRIASLNDIFISQWSHYFTWGGRVIAHSILQFFVWIGKDFFNIANTIAFGFFIWLSNKISTGSNNIKTFNIIWIFFSWWICTEQLLMSSIWLTGSCNYLWMAVLQLFFMSIYVNHLRSCQSKSCSFSFIIFITITGLAAGWSNEIGSTACVVMVTIMLFILYKQDRLVVWNIAGAVGLIIGTVMLIKAPGNLQRMSMVYPDFHWSFSLDYLKTVLIYLKGPYFKILSKEFILFIPIIYYFFKRTSNKLSINEILILTFMAGGLTVPTVMLAAPEFDTHVGFTSTVFIIISSLMAIEEIQKKDLKPKILTFNIKLVKAIAGMICVAIMVSMLLCLRSDISIYMQTQNQLHIIEQQRNKSIINVPPIKSPGAYEKFFNGKTTFYYMRHIGGITKDENHYRNVAVSKYYGINKIIAVDN